MKERENFYIGEVVETSYDEKKLILIIYDIIDNKRRTKFFKFLSGYMTPVQKSCFESHLTDKEFDRLREKIHFYIDPSEDNVRCYKLSAYGQVYNIGVDRGSSTEEIVII